MLLVFIVVVGIIFRLVPLKIWVIEGSDAWSHIYDAKYLSQCGWEIPEKVNGFFPEPEFTYPWAIAWLLGKAAPADPIRFFVCLNILFSLLEMLSASAFIWYISSEMFGMAGDTVYFSVCATMGVYAISPLVLSPWAGVYGINARVFGALAVNTSLLSLGVGLAGGGPLFLLLSAALVPAMVLSSQFAVQAVVVGSIVLSVAHLSLLPISIILSGFIGTLVVTKGVALKILKGHFYHVKIYGQYFQYHNVSTVHRTWGVFRWLKELRARRDVLAAIRAMVWVPLIRVFVWNPWLLLLPFYFAELNDLQSIQISLGALVLGGLLIIPVITYKHFRFLGEPDRYFTFFSTLPLAVIVGLLVPRSEIGWAMYFCILLCCLIASISMLIEKSRIRRSDGSDLEQEIARVLSNLNSEEEGRVLLVPQNMADKIACFCDCVFVGIHTNVTWDTSKWHYYVSLFSNFYPYPSCSVVEMKKKFGVKYLVFAKRFVADSYIQRHHMEKRDITEFPENEPVFENSRFAIYKL